MKKDLILDVLGIFGSIITALSFLEKPFFQSNKIVLLTLGIITLGTYFKLYVEDKAIFRIKLMEKRLNIREAILNNRMDKQENEISMIKGWVEAINFFKSKRGVIDPITLIVVLIIVTVHSIIEGF